MHNRVDNPDEIKHCDFMKAYPNQQPLRLSRRQTCRGTRRCLKFFSSFGFRASLPREGCPRDMGRKWKMPLCQWSRADSCPGRINFCQMAKLMLCCTKHGSRSLATCTDCQDSLGLLVTGRAPPGWKWRSMERGVCVKLLCQSHLELF